MSDIQREKARARRRGIVVVIALLAVLAIFGVVFKGYWDERVRSAYDQSQDVYTPEPKKQPKVALWLGDSSVQGAGASDTALRMSSLVSQRFGWYEINLGLGGSGYRAGNPNLVDQIDSLKRYKPNYIFVSAGRNDGWSEDVRASVYTFYQDLRELFPKARLIVIAPLTTQIPETPNPQSEGLGQLRNSVRSAAYSANGEYLSIGDLLAGKANLLSTDGYSINDAGYKALADAVIKALKK